MPAGGGARFAALCCASVVSAGLVFGGGVAVAADAPAPGTAECRDAVNLNADVRAQRVKVQTALDALNKANQGGDPATIANAQQDVADAKSLLAVQVANVTNRVCTGTVTTTPPVTTIPPRTTTPPAEDPTPLTDDRDCDDFSSRDAAQAYFLDRRTAAQPDPDRLDRNGNGIACEGSFGDDTVAEPAEPADEQPTTQTRPSVVGGAQVDNNVTVNPTQDDGSVADTDGSQVEVTPEGSASTGAA